jgi:hypothetical protein
MRSLVPSFYIDITTSSQQVWDDPELIAGDDLYPSPKMYSAWVQLLLPIAQEILIIQILTPQQP